MSAIRTSVRHRDSDWASLSERLDQAMPGRRTNRRMAWLLPFVFFILLFSSNIFWWSAYRDNKVALGRLETRLSLLHRDTIWQTVYVRAPGFSDYYLPEKASVKENAFSNVFNTGFSLRPKDVFHYRPAAEFEGNQHGGTGLIPDLPGKPARLDEEQEQGIKKSLIQPFENLNPANPVALTGQAFSFSGMEVDFVQKQGKSIRSIAYSLWKAVKPKEVKVGAVAGWLQPIDPALVHEVGFETGAQAVVGFSRHWSALFEYTYGQLHYEAGDASGILGSPVLPALPTPEHYYAYLDVNRQPVWQYGLGIRYSFSRLGRFYPYIDLNWGNQTFLPYSISYELHHEPSGAIQQGNYSIGHYTRIRNILRLKAGLEIPLSRRLGISLEGYYLRPWGPGTGKVFDMAGFRAGVNGIIF